MGNGAHCGQWTTYHMINISDSGEEKKLIKMNLL